MGKMKLWLTLVLSSIMIFSVIGAMLWIILKIKKMLNEIRRMKSQASSRNSRNLYRIIEAHEIYQSEANIDELKT